MLPPLEQSDTKINKTRASFVKVFLFVLVAIGNVNIYSNILRRDSNKCISTGNSSGLHIEKNLCEYCLVSLV